MKYRGKDVTIACKLTRSATTQARFVEDEFSQLQAGQLVIIGSYRKWLAEQGKFRATRNTRRRAVRSDEQSKDYARVVHAQEVQV